MSKTKFLMPNQKNNGHHCAAQWCPLFYQEKKKTAGWPAVWGIWEGRLSLR